MSSSHVPNPHQEMKFPIRKNPQHITIAHLSDLHFTSQTIFPPKPNADVCLVELVESLKKHQPDVVCITGDVASNTWRESLKGWSSDPVGDTGALEAWNCQLRGVFDRSLDFFKYLCSELDIDISVSFFIVPGNHDYRIQGIYSGFFDRLLNKRSYNGEPTEFTKVFNDYFKNRAVRFDYDNSFPAIELKVVCLNSNHTDVALNFATGAVSTQELQKLSLLEEMDSANGDTGSQAQGHPPKPVSFRACLVHHHPLPIASAEAIRESDRTRRIGVIRNIAAVATGEQTNLFKNGSSFLLKCLDNGVDLVMHGHQHHSWFSVIQYPAKGTRRLLVSGAGSTGVAENKTDIPYEYCIYRMDVSGNISVEEYTTKVTPTRYEKTDAFSVYKYSELRSSRREKLIEQLREENVPGTDCKYGIAIAEEYLRTTRIRLDGNVDYIRLYRNLRPTGQQPIKAIPIRASSEHGFIGHEVRPKIKIVDDPRKYYRTVGWEPVRSSNEQILFGQLVFDPPLHPGHPLSLQVEYTLYNAVELVQEYRRAAIYPKSDDYEKAVTILKAINAEVLSEVVIFPEKLGPPQRPRLHVSGPGSDKLEDGAETVYCQDSLNILSEPGIISLKVKEPLPNFNYTLSWHLPSEAEYNNKVFARDGLEIYNRIVKSSIPRPAVINSLTGILHNLQQAFSSPIEADTEPWFDRTTGLSLLLAVRRESASDGRIDVVLHRVTHIDAEDDHVSTGDKSIRPGIGVAGQAFKSRGIFLYNLARGEDLSIYYRFPDQRKIHSVLLAVPLPVIKLTGDLEPVHPMYGVICIGSIDPKAQLNRLTKSSDAFLWINEKIQDYVNGAILEVLTNA